MKSIYGPVSGTGTGGEKPNFGRITDSFPTGERVFRNNPGLLCLTGFSMRTSKLALG
jgi:hypothetical protein